MNGENSSVIDILPTLTSLSTGVVQAGRYSGNYTASGATDNNYGFSYINGNLDVLNVSLPSTVEYPSQYPIMISTQVGGNTGGQAVIYRIGTDENDTGDNENDSPTLTEEEAQFSSFRTKPIIITISPELVRILSLTQEDL